MSLTLFRHAAQKPRLGPLSLDLGNPLTDNLIRAYLFNDVNEVPTDYSVKRQVMTYNNGTPTWTSGLRGTALNLAAAPWLDIGILGTAPASWVGLITPTVSLTGDDRIMSTISGGSSLGGSTRMGAGGIWEVWSGSAWNQIGPSNTFVVGTPVTLCAVYDTGGTTTGYVNGILGGSGTSNFDFGSDDAGIGARYVNSFGNNPNMSVECWYVFNRTLSAAEAALLSLNPYAIWLQRPLQRWWSIQAPAGSVHPRLEEPMQNTPGLVVLNVVRPASVW